MYDSIHTYITDKYIPILHGILFSALYISIAISNYRSDMRHIICHNLVN